MGVGEEGAVSQRRSPMWDLTLECRDHTLSQRQTLNDCTTQVPQVRPILKHVSVDPVGYCQEQSSFGWGNVLPFSGPGVPGRSLSEGSVPP